MDPKLARTLQKVRRRMTAWHAMVKLKWGLAAICGALFVVGWLDLLVRLEQGGRVGAWIPLVLLLAATLWLVWSALSRAYSNEGIAAALEKTFPDLDNRLINFLQFSREPSNDRFKTAYLKNGFPDLDKLDLRQLKDRKAHKWSLIALLSLAIVLAAPGLVYGKPWFIALWRAVNPFSPIELPTLTKILDVTPGDTTIPTGQGVLLNTKVQGFKGHEVFLEMDSADGPDETVSLGKISSGNEETFSRQIPRLATTLKYRFRAGDSYPSQWFTVTTKAPTAFTGIEATLTPPAHTRLAPSKLNLQKDPLLAKAGSRLQISLQSNADLTGVEVSGAVQAPVPLSSVDKNPRRWAAEVVLAPGASLMFVAKEGEAIAVTEEIAVTVQPDEPPEITIVEPTVASILPAGSKPQIHFEVKDDYGLSAVEVQLLPPDQTPEAPATPLQSWNIEGRPAFNQVWKADIAAAPGKKLAFRVVARDTHPDKPNEKISESIVFTTPTTEELLAKKNELANSAATGIDQLLELQKANIEETERLAANLKKFDAAKWMEAATRQEKIREVLKALIDTPLQPLGSLTELAKKLYLNESSQAVEALKSVASGAAARREEFAKEALDCQNRILRQLTPADDSMAESIQNARLTGLAAMLAALIKGQEDLLTKTSELATAKGKASADMVDAQDALAEDVQAFIRTAREDAKQTETSDAGFALSLNKAADQTEKDGIQKDMVLAAENLDQQRLEEAKPPQESAIRKLKAISGSLNELNLAEENEKTVDFLEAVGEAKEKIEKIQDLHKKMRESIDAVKAQANHDTDLVDKMEDAYAEMVKNTKEALLEVPTDLHIFAEMNTANDLVEDVFSIFEEIEQVAKEETNPDGTKKEFEAKDKAYAKEDALMNMMGEAKERLDACEMWLGEKADAAKITTEAIDREEMPDSGIAMAELATAAEDLVGDLLKESEENASEADDGATNHAMSDFPSGWETMEGNIASFGAQGKSGNTAPDHKEQDGRSNVGRQGMASGETAAGSGKIGKGDDNIEARRTQDPIQSGQVDAEGEAKTAATGGGKQASGKADDVGMSGGTRRVDSTEQGSYEGMAAIMAKKADALYAEASLKNVRVDALKNAAEHIRQSADAIAKGDIRQMKEHKKLAAGQLLEARAQLQAGPNSA
ncbi:MAG: hypothetical protein ACKOLA_13130, partial [Spartobacteria bacterium]